MSSSTYSTMGSFASSSSFSESHPSTGTYSSFGHFGSSRNRNVFDPYDAANPLSYSIIPSFNTLFLHGPTGDNASIYRVWAPNCQTFMAEYGAIHPGNPFVKAYLSINQDQYWPNTAVIDKMAMNLCYQAYRIQPCLGEMMMHNACERRYLQWATTTFSYQPFDPSVANSPMIRVYAPTSLLGRPRLRQEFFKDPDQEWWIDQMMENPNPVLDIWVRFYSAWKYHGELNVSSFCVPPKMLFFLRQKQEKLETLYRWLCQKINQYDVELLPTTASSTFPSS